MTCRYGASVGGTPGEASPKAITRQECCDASTASIDLHAKLHAYQRNGVREYLVWRVLDNAFDWFVLRHGRFEAMMLPGNGILNSEVFPGLRLDAAAIVLDAVDRAAKKHWRLLFPADLRHALPHLPRPASRISELVDQRFHNLLAVLGFSPSEKSALDGRS